MVTEYRINVSRLDAVFPLAWRQKMSDDILRAVAGITSGFEIYWSHLGHAFGRHEALPKGWTILDDLAAPNVAVLDWFLEQGLDKDVGIADIPCGLGNLMVCLRRLGFCNVWGYDNWAQIERERAVAFLQQYQALGSLVDLPTIIAKAIDILCVIGLPFEWLLPDIQPVIDKAQYVLVDTGYLPKEPLVGFEEIGRYPGLLAVYRAKGNACSSR